MKSVIKKSFVGTLLFLSFNALATNPSPCSRNVLKLLNESKKMSYHVSKKACLQLEHFERCPSSCGFTCQSDLLLKIKGPKDQSTLLIKAHLKKVICSEEQRELTVLSISNQ